MISLAHIIHPVITDNSSDLKVAQPVTFATMKAASEFARWFGRAIIINMATFANNFRIFKDMQATFHIGNDQIW